jgi:hypothetical protein
MNPKLQQAIVAARAGQRKEAQLLLAQLLQDNPEEVHAWFLLSHLVDSEQKQLAYLKKTVELDPNHAKATQQLAQLESVVLPTASLDLDDTSLDSSLPAWMTEGAEELNLDVANSAPSPSEESDSVAWLEDMVNHDTPSTDTAKKASSVAESYQRNGGGRKKQESPFTLTLIGLIAAAAIVFILLLYTIFTAF